MLHMSLFIFDVLLRKWKAVNQVFLILWALILTGTGIS